MIGRRVSVLGNTCSGKSTLAAALSAQLGLPQIELDALYWKPHWVASAADEFRARLAEATAGEAWVTSGSYMEHSRAVLWPRLQTAIWLDLPLRTLLPRIWRRSWRRWRERELLWGTNRERLWQQFVPRAEQSLFVLALRSQRRRRRALAAAAADPRWSHITWIRLRSAGEVDRWLARAQPGPDRGA